MAGGGFLGHGIDTNKYNRSLLRKTKDKKNALTSIRGAKGPLDSTNLSEAEQQEVLLYLKKERQKDLKKRLLLLLVVTVIIVTVTISIFS